MTLKRIFGMALILLLVLLGTGMFLPSIISTDKLPMPVILLILAGAFIVVSVSFIYLIKILILGKRALAELKKFHDSPEDLFNYSTEQKK